jgi:hypothetical protein
VLGLTPVANGASGPPAFRYPGRANLLGADPPAWHPRKSQSPASEQQVEDEYDQQNATDTNATAISPPAIAVTATAEEKDQYYNNQDQVHSSPSAVVSRSSITPYRIMQSQSIA